MRKFNKIALVVALFLMIPLVWAASVPYQWLSGDEKINVGQPNAAGTASLEKDGKTVTLSLNNYNGPALVLDCYGTGQDGMKFIITLEGDNVITTDNVGIDSGSSIVEFKGNGTLTINAPKPLSFEDFKERVVVKPAEGIYGEEKPVLISDKENPSLIAENENPSLIAEDESNEEATGEMASDEFDSGKEVKDNQSIVVPVIFGVLIGVLLAVVVFTLVIKKKKKED